MDVRYFLTVLGVIAGARATIDTGLNELIYRYGCFDDGTFNYTGSPEDIVNNFPGTCLDHCKRTYQHSSVYIALQGSKCKCMQSKDVNQSLSNITLSSGCNQSCPGHTSHFCGNPATSVSSMYRIEYNATNGDSSSCISINCGTKSVLEDCSTAHNTFCVNNIYAGQNCHQQSVNRSWVDALDSCLNTSDSIQYYPDSSLLWPLCPNCLVTDDTYWIGGFGQWAPPKNCTPSIEDLSKQIQNGQGDVLNENAITFHCDGGFNISRNVTRFCMANGSWTDEQPHCTGLTTTSTSTTSTTRIRPSTSTVVRASSFTPRKTTPTTTGSTLKNGVTTSWITVNIDTNTNKSIATTESTIKTTDTKINRSIAITESTIKTDPDNKSPPLALIIGICIGIVAIAVVACIIGYCIIRKKKKNNKIGCDTVDEVNCTEETHRDIGVSSNPVSQDMNITSENHDIQLHGRYVNISQGVQIILNTNGELNQPPPSHQLNRDNGQMKMKAADTTQSSDKDSGAEGEDICPSLTDKARTNEDNFRKLPPLQPNPSTSYDTKDFNIPNNEEDDELTEEQPKKRKKKRKKEKLQNMEQDDELTEEQIKKRKKKRKKENLLDKEEIEGLTEEQIKELKKKRKKEKKLAKRERRNQELSNIEDLLIDGENITQHAELIQT